jgi:radical SAM protein with 4Fe4S-binding SPASM domain
MKRRPYYKQPPPFNVSFELTLGCDLRCPACAVGTVQAAQGKGYKFMEKSTLVKVVEEVAALKWNCRIGFAMRGEPTRHPDYIGMVAAVHDILPKAHITMLTNAGGLLRKPGPVENVMGLFCNGLAVLGLDDYVGIKYVGKVLEPFGTLKSGQRHEKGFTFYKYPENRAGNPHVRRPRGSKTLVQIRDLNEQDKVNRVGTHSRVFNYAGLGLPPDDSMEGKRCHHPFRQLVVQWNGTVPGCCNDWSTTYRCGNVLEQGLEEIWQGTAFGAMREMLVLGKREFKPCLGCNHRSYRVGLLPDSAGQDRLHRPDAQTAADIAEVLKHPPHTPIINPPPWHNQ